MKKQVFYKQVYGDIVFVESFVCDINEEDNKNDILRELYENPHIRSVWFKDYKEPKKQDEEDY